MPFMETTKKYYKKGKEPDVIEIGSWGMIEGATVKKVGQYNYITQLNTVTINTTTYNSWEAVFSIKTPDVFTEKCFIFGTSTLPTNIDSHNLYIDNNGVICYNIIEGTNNTSVSFITDSESLNTGSFYLIKIEWKENKYWLYKKDKTTSNDWILVGNNSAARVDIRSKCIGNGYIETTRYPFYGEIYLDECYIKVDNELVWDVWKDYTAKGNWIIDGVAGTFTPTTNLQIPEKFYPTNKNWEILLKVNTGDFVTNVQNPLIGEFSTSYSLSGLFLYLYNSKVYLRVYDGESSKQVYSAQKVLKDTDYWIKVKYESGNYTLSYGTEDNVSIEDISFASDIVVKNNITLTLGAIDNLKQNDKYKNCLSTIDLSQSYIKTHNGYIWAGLKGVRSTENDYDFYTAKKRMCQLAKPKRFYYDYSNEANVTTVGNRSIVLDGVASNFKAASYLLLPDTFDIAGGKPWEIVTCFETGSDVTTEGNLVGTNYYRYDPVSLSITSSHFILEVCSGTGTTVFEAKGSYAVQPNTKYWLRAYFNGSEYIVEYSLDGVDYVVDITKASTVSAYSQPLIIGGQAASDNGTVKFPWLGSIYLKECYVKIDGEYWWNGATDGYTAVGKWIDEGVASGFSSSQYITVPRPFVEASKAWEAVIKIKTGALSNNNLFIGGKSKFKSGVCVYIATSGNLNISLSGNGSSWSIAEGTTIATGFTANTDYWIKAEFTGDKYKFSYSVDGIEWSEPYIVNSSVPIYSSDYWMLGAGYAGGTTFYTLNSAVYLNDCYIKSGDRLWWHGTKVVEGNKDNYAFYEDRLLSYAPILNNKLY